MENERIEELSNETINDEEEQNNETTDLDEVDDDEEEEILDDYVEAKTFEIRDDMPEEIKKQLQEINEMSAIINATNSDSDDEDEYIEDSDDENVASDDKSVKSLSENDTVEYSDIF